MGWRVPEIGEKVVVKNPDFQSSQDGIKSGDVGKVLGHIGDDEVEEILLLLYNPDWSNMDYYHTVYLDDTCHFSSSAEKFPSCLVYIRECDLLVGVDEDQVEL